MPIDYGDVIEAESEHPLVPPSFAAEAGWGIGMRVEETYSASAAEGG